MISKIDLAKSARYLFSFAVLLLLIAIVIDSYISIDKPELKKKGITSLEADSLFKQALKNYGINERFISVKPNKTNPGASIYSVKVYQNVPISLILLEIENLFFPTKAKIQSKEVLIGRKTITKISIDNKTILTAEFISNNNLIREKGKIGFVVYNLDYSVDNSSLLNTPEQIIFLLTPSGKSKKFVGKILSAGKRYALLINDEVQDLNYKIDESYQIKRNKKSFENLFKNFPSAAFIVIDDRSDLFNSAISNFILKELNWRKAFYYKISQFDLIDSFPESIQNAFGEIIKAMNKNESKIILIDSKNFKELLPLIPSYRKVGYRFVSATELLK